MPDLTRFDTGPEALARARGHVEALAARYRERGRRCEEGGFPDNAAMWRKVANLLEMELAGGKGCVITPFDERRAELAALLAASGKETADGDRG